MKKYNAKEINWSQIEEMAVAYNNESNEYMKEEILASIYATFKGYIRTSVQNAVIASKGVQIPKEDFESFFYHYLWESIKAFDPNGEYALRQIVQARFKYAKSHAAKLYKTKGDENDKKGVTYAKGRWDSLDRKIGGESEATLADVVLGTTISAEEAIDCTKSREDEILDEFEALFPRYGNVIRFMAKGYEGDELAVVTGEGEKNDGKMRKLVQRSRESFRKFMQER